MPTFLGVPIVVDGEPYGHLYVADKQRGEAFTGEDEEAVTLLADFAGVAIDRARRLAGSEAGRAELQRTVDLLDATTSIAQALGGHTNAGEILDLVSERGRELVSARALLIEVERGGELEVVAGAGELPPGLIGRRRALEGTVARVALATRTSQSLIDGSDRSRFEQSGLGLLGVAARDGLVVPLVFRNEAYGVLEALDRLDGTRFTTAHQRLLESFAASAASALATARSAALERRRQSLSAAERERARWARELHDETLQGLASLRLLLGTAQRKGEAARANAIAQALDQLDLDIAGLRSLIADLRPAALDELGIEAAVRALGERFEWAGLGVDVSLDLAFEQGRSSARHLPALEIAIYRIVQEALTNAARHGRASHAVVEIADADDAVRVSVRDDGHGFDPDEVTTGFGLLGMLERSELLGGVLSIDSRPGGPTTIAATLPLARHADP